MKKVDIHPAYKDMSDQELEEHIRHKLESHPVWVRRALLALYDEQTEDEKRNPDEVHESNGWGFSPNDQKFLSSLAEQALHGYSFSLKQQGWLYTLLPKYSGQLVRLIRQAQQLDEITHTFDLQEGRNPTATGTGDKDD